MLANQLLVLRTYYNMLSPTSLLLTVNTSNLVRVGSTLLDMTSAYTSKSDIIVLIRISIYQYLDSWVYLDLPAWWKCPVFVLLTLWTSSMSSWDALIGTFWFPDLYSEHYFLSCAISFSFFWLPSFVHWLVHIWYWISIHIWLWVLCVLVPPLPVYSPYLQWISV